MFTYLLKRFLYLLPTVWVIITLMFLLSRFIPGSFLDLKISSLSEQTQHYISPQQHQDLYLDNQKKYGADKPVFYFSLRSSAEPDTFNQISSEKEKAVLRQWVLEKGNWPLIQDYYLFAKNLQIQFDNPALQTLTNQADRSKINHFMDQLKQQSNPGQKIYSKLIDAEQKLYQIENAAFDFKRFIPDFTWHGSQNQYHNWLSNAISGNFGSSYRNEQPVMELLLEATLNTLFLMLISFALIIFFAIQLSLFLAHSGQKRFKNAILAALQIIDGIPVFLLTLSVLILVSLFGPVPLFPVLGLPQSETSSWLQQIGVWLYYLALPIFCLTLARLPYFVTQLYHSLQHVLAQDYIKTAKAKGISEKKILREHALRNAILPLITALTEFLPGLLAGSLVIEIIFAIPGVGRLLADSVLARDYPVVLGIVLLVAVLKVLSNIIADLLYYLADPKIKLA